MMLPLEKTPHSDFAQWFGLAYEIDGKRTKSPTHVANWPNHKKFIISETTRRVSIKIDHVPDLVMSHQSTRYQPPALKNTIPRQNTPKLSLALFPLFIDRFRSDFEQCFWLDIPNGWKVDRKRDSRYSPMLPTVQITHTQKQKSSISEQSEEAILRCRFIIRNDDFWLGNIL